MPYTNPGFVNNSQPAVNATNMNNLANEVQSLSSTMQCVPVNKGGTGATTASGARANLGLNVTGINNLINSQPIPVSLGGTGKNSLDGILELLGMQPHALAFQVFSGEDYRLVKGYSTSTSVNIVTIDSPCCIYVGGTSTADYVRFVDVPSTITANYYIFTFFAPGDDTIAKRRIYFVIPEVGRDVYMNIVHGNSETGWGKLSFTAV